MRKNDRFVGRSAVTDAGTTKKAQMTGAEALVRMLEAHSVKYLFGLCGDTTLPFYDALYRLDHGIEHILTRDERSAAYMADAYARVTNRVGVCEGPSGGGATYILPGLIEANDSSIPILAITSDINVSSQGHYPLTELDQGSLMRPLTKWNAVIPKAEMLPNLVRTAFRQMTTGRPGSAHLGLPIDVQRDPVDASEVWADQRFGEFPAHPSSANPKSIDAALDAILGAEHPVIICGGGVVISGGEAELDKLARRLDIVVATTISGQGSLAETHPNCLGVVGTNGGVPSTRDVVAAADLVVFLSCRAGSVTTERWQMPSKETRIVHIDSDPVVIGATYRTEVGVVGDARLVLAELNARLDDLEPEQKSFGGADIVAAAKKAKWSAFNSLATSDDRPILPERFVAELQRVLPDDAVVVADPGTPCPYLSAFYELKKPGRHFFSNRAHGALGYSLSASMGAWYGRPDQKIVAVMGDGSFGFTCGEFETVVRKSMPITFIVISNSIYGWIKAGQRAGFGERYYSVDFSRTDHAAVAAAFGVKSWRVDDPSKLRSVLQQAVEHGGPTLVDIVCQPLHEANAPVTEWIA